jgi:hypothetical protein
MYVNEWMEGCMRDACEWMDGWKDVCMRHACGWMDGKMYV